MVDGPVSLDSSGWPMKITPVTLAGRKGSSWLGLLNWVGGCQLGALKPPLPERTTN